MFLRLLAGPFGPYIICAAALVIGALAFFGWLKIHDSNIVMLATMKQNIKQMEQVIEDQKKFNEKLKVLETLGVVTVEEVKKKNEELNNVAKKIEQDIDAKSIKGIDDPAHDSLQETVKALRGSRK